jgi:hypothetical protein
MKGIQEFKELCVFLAVGVTAQQKAGADGSYSGGDALYAIPALQALVPALGGVTEIPGEVADMDPAEAAEVAEAIKGALDLTSDGVEAIVEQIMEIGLQLASAALAYKSAKAV